MGPPRCRADLRHGPLALCAAAILAAPLAAQSPPAEPIVIRSVTRHVTETGAELRFAVTGRSTQIRLATEPGGAIVLTLPRHRPAPGLDRISYDSGLIASVELRYLATEPDPPTQVWVRTRGRATSTVRPSDAELRLELYPVEGPGEVEGSSAAAFSQTPAPLPGAAAATAAPTSGTELRVSFEATPCLNLRQAATPRGPSIDCLQPGTALSLIESDGSWRRVRDGSGSVGWVAAAYLETIPRDGPAAVPESLASRGRGAASAGLQAELQQARTAITHYVEDRDELLSRLEEASAERDALRRSAATQDTARQTLARELEQARQELSDARARAASSDRTASLPLELEASRAAAAELERRLDNAQQALGEYAKARSELTERVERLERERRDLASALESSEAARDQIAGDLDNDRAELEAARRESSDLAADTRSRLAATQAELATAVAARKELQTEIENLRRDNAELRLLTADREEVQGRLEAVATARVELQDQVERLRRDNAELTPLAADRDDLEGQLEAATTANDKLQTAIESLRRDNAELTTAAADRDELRNRLEAAVRSEGDLEQRLAAATSALTAGGLVVADAAEPCLNLRAGPAGGEEALDCLAPGTRLDLLESGSDWLRVRLADGRSGWTAAGFVVAASIADLAAARRELDRVRESGRELERERNDLTVELGAEREAGAVRLRELGDSLTRSVQERDDLTSRLDRATATRQRLEAEAALSEPAEARAVELAARLDETLAELEAMRGGLRAAQERANALEEEKKGWLETRATLEGDLREATELAQRDTADAEGLRRDSAAARAEVERLAAAASADREELERLRRSETAARRQLAAARAESTEALARLARLTAAGPEGALRVSAAAAPCLRLRPTPEPDSRSIDCLAPGTTARLLDLLGEWRQVRLADGRTGWMAAGFLEEAERETERRHGELERDLRQRLAEARAERDTAQAAQLGEARAAAAGAAGDTASELPELRRSAADLTTRLESAQAALADHGRIREELSARLEDTTRQRDRLRQELARRVSPSASIPPDAAAPDTAPPDTAAPSNAALAPSATLPGTDPAVAVVAAVQGWANAWSDQRVEDYLAAYARGFRPTSGLRREAWAAQRRSRLRRPGFIELTLGPLEVVVGADRAVARFEQSYRSDTFADRVLKELVLVREDGAWKILAEQSLETLR